ncbi:hypothetical protein ATANTOWER_019720 [Ataeniobius toweri]|uniref:Secreted protein n=1 Tax=Ataeniobius toweri TaxID=208326 RepID=A0ABU7AZH1_9TELE|nr:hypothetical protein [Ataeniobius toweri]
MCWFIFLLGQSFPRFYYLALFPFALSRLFTLHCSQISSVAISHIPLCLPATQFLTCYHFPLNAFPSLSLVHTPPSSVYQFGCFHCSSLGPPVYSPCRHLAS